MHGIEATCYYRCRTSVLSTRVCHAKTAEPIEMPFGGLTHLGQRMGSRSDESVLSREG